MIGIALISILCTAYLVFGALQSGPFTSYIHATMVVSNSGGVTLQSPVLVTGIQVGRVTSIRNTAAGVEIGFEVVADRRIPLDSLVTIEYLSMLGPPFVEFRPNTGTGPYLQDGQRLATDHIRMPLAAPNVAGLFSRVVSQLDPRVLESLVDTGDVALYGTDAAVANLARTGNSVAAALMSRSPQIATLYRELQSAAADLDWAGPAATAAAPALVRFTQALNELTAAVEQFIESQPPERLAADGGVLAVLERLTAVLRDTPALQQIVPILQQLADAMRPSSAATPNLSVLLEQALNAVTPEGAVRLRVTVK
ncbi:MlaD family protein [Nocardia sp. NPDC056064]|uniref:MlaD family protein n=1 Tax=Nocardia sp. NPDC056064 TaxID=3345701 RepID=UPI0035E0ECC5